MDDVAYGDSKVSNPDPETIPVADRIPLAVISPTQVVSPQREIDLSKNVATGHATELTIAIDDVGPVEILPQDSSPEVLKVEPVKVGLLRSAFEFNADCVAVEVGFRASLVLSTFPSPTAALEIPATVPAKVGLASGAFAFKAACVRPEIGLFASVVLSTLPRPTAALDIPATVPVKVGLLIGAFAFKASV